MSIENKEKAHQLANSYVKKIENDYLEKLSHDLTTVRKEGVEYRKIQGKIEKEMYRIYGVEACDDSPRSDDIKDFRDDDIYPSLNDPWNPDDDLDSPIGRIR